MVYMMTHHELDVKGKLCPMPVIKSQNLAKKLPSGDSVTVIATDPGALHDVPSWCRISNHELIDIQEKNGEIHITFKIRG